MSGQATFEELRPNHSEHLARFRIPNEVLSAACVRSVTDFETRDLFGEQSYRGHDLSGILFPYFDPFTGARVGGRIRLDHPVAKMKYLSERRNRHLFIPRGIPLEWFADTSIPVVIVEAEKSALAIWALAQRNGLKLIPVAIGGAWGWLRKSGIRPMPDGRTEPETAPSPDFNLFAWEERAVIVMFDSNVVRNPDVRTARRRLAQELAARGARVRIAHVPAEPQVNGPDDLIAIGDEPALRIMDLAQPFADCAIAEAETAISELEANKESDPLPAVEAIASIQDSTRRALLIARLAGLRVPGVNKPFIESRVRDSRAAEEARRSTATEACRHGRLLGMHVDLAALLDEVCAFIQRFVVLSRQAAIIIALWTVHAYTLEAADSTPYLSVNSAEKRSGKSRLLEVLEPIVPKPWYTGRATPAVLYRKIDAEAPTLLLDETDAAFKGNEDYAEALRAILNSGHRRGGKATCCVSQGAALSHQDFSTFCPKVIAGIGKLPDTVADRSIPIRLKRKARAEKVERFRPRNVRTEAENLRERLEAWATQNIERLRDARPELPEELSDRQQDGAEPLLAISDLAGGEWPKAARSAIILLCRAGEGATDTIGTLMLSDIRQMFTSQDTDRLSSVNLVGLLAGIETSPWGEWSKGKPITVNGLAKLLKPFDIGPHPVRDNDQVFRGYQTADFEDAWQRYCSTEDSPPSVKGVTALQTASDAASSESAYVTSGDAVTAASAQEPAADGACNVVTPSARDHVMEEEL